MPQAPTPTGPAARAALLAKTSNDAEEHKAQLNRALAVAVQSLDALAAVKATIAADLAGPSPAFGAQDLADLSAYALYAEGRLGADLAPKLAALKA